MIRQRGNPGFPHQYASGNKTVTLLNHRKISKDKSLYPSLTCPLKKIRETNIAEIDKHNDSLQLSPL